jgi:hypothetical protein
LKQKDLRRARRRIGVVVGKKGEKSSECEENILSVGGKPEEAGNLKKYLKSFRTYFPPPRPPERT